MIIQIDDVLVSLDILTECFCCDLTKCKGECCIEGDAGAPITLDEMEELERYLEDVKQDLSVPAQLVIASQGVSYVDEEGDLVTSIVNGRDCVFTCYKDLELPDGTVKNCCLCAYEKAYREGKIGWCKPISCALYPIRETTLSNGLTALTYHRWHVCKDAVVKGKALNMPVYQFLKEPLVKRFGEEWYDALCTAAKEVKEQGYQ